MVIIAWSPSGLLSSIFEADVFRNVSTIFITAAFLNFLQGKKILWDSSAFYICITSGAAPALVSKTTKFLNLVF